jgi:hypothetical protein
MRNSFAALIAASLLIFLAVPVARAAPTSVNVRIEGRVETLFEKTISVEPRKVQASSDTTERRCDGINANDPQNTVPAVTPTSAAADAMASIGESFDGQWYEGFEDYFLTRWGPDAQDPGTGAYWGIIVNEVFTNVGGCQLQLDDGDEVLWVYDAFKGRPSIALFPAEAHYSAGPRPQTAVAQLGVPFPVEVVSYADDEESVPGASPSRTGSSPYAGAEVAPVTTNAKGFQRVETSSPKTVTTDSAGRGTIVFDEPGIHRIKATVGSPGEEPVIRSNHLDVCVPAAFGECGEVASPSPPPSAHASQPSHPRIGRTKLNFDRIAQGWVGVSWKMLDPGAGIRSWSISSKALGHHGARFVSRAKGRKQTSARIHLPAGTHKLRLTLIDAVGQKTTFGLGKVTVPRGRQR